MSKLCDFCTIKSIDDHCEKCSHKDGRCVELCDDCFHYKLEKQKIQEEMKKNFGI